MIEAAMIWNEPNNKSHWDPELDPGWSRFAEMTRLAGAALKAEAPKLPRVLGGISPIDPSFLRALEAQRGLEEIDLLAVHGFPLDWNLWPIHDWPLKLAEISAITHKPIWVSEAGVSSFGADEVQAWGLKRTAELLKPLSPRIHWYSLYDLPMEWGATTRHKEAEGSSYYRHFHMGLIRADGSVKPAYRAFAEHTPELGLCQWFHFEDPRLDSATRHFRELGVTYLRTGLSWADSYRPGWEAWFDRMMKALEPFRVTVTFCFTPEQMGLAPHHTSPPREPAAFAEFCTRMIRRYG